MTRTPMIILAAALCSAMVAGSLSAQTALKDVAHVREGLITVGIAYEISEKCGVLGARLFRGIGYLNSLKDHARGLGFSEAQISAYTDDRSEQRKLEQIARDRLAGMGAVAGQEPTYCAVGRAEIANGSAIGRLLY